MRPRGSPKTGSERSSRKYRRQHWRFLGRAQTSSILGIRSGSRPRLGYADDARGIQESDGAERLADNHKPRPEGDQGAVSRGEAGWLHRRRPATPRSTFALYAAVVTPSGVFYVPSVRSCERRSDSQPSRGTPDTRQQIRIHEKWQQLANLQTVKTLMHFSFDIHLTSFGRKSTAHGSTRWRVTVHYGLKRR